MASNIEVAPVFAIYVRKGTKILFVKDHARLTMKPFCVKTKVIGYANLEVGRSKKEEEDGEIGGLAVFW